eukprot:CAMPEP_0182918896 /NCGR_PEP_ID=MMETSP0105_2-20130417/2358_1 /TAXON_ID=81532 ORGANISM="Acanthoeca-like sp., Strain 10tr" /NCGR_SAMPLE_ID=MMETSP0105_2 /ASSEMBLY_ACC=CAM_ASM_000205 /LENGTH=150 /DNA_ID=CAMNT_0025056019 /DNA_START=521 /DNA_END=973 /DNA_ORIENTATION=+
MNSDGLNADLVQGPMGLLIHLALLDVVQRIKPIDHPAKDGVLAIERRSLGVCDEELRAVGVGASIGHRHHPTLVVSQVVHDLVLKLVAPDGLATFAGTSGVAGLHHKPFDVAMYQHAVVIPAGAQCKKILTRLVTLVTEQLEFNIAEVCV